MDRQPRTLGVWSGEVVEQEQCALLRKLPAEIRNGVYEYVFVNEAQQDEMEDQEMGTGASNEQETEVAPSRPVHPFDLLLTCRRINMEATITAFRIHRFVFNTPLTFDAFCQRTAILPSPSLSAITGLVLEIKEKEPDYHPYDFDVPGFLYNALRLSPNIKHLTVKVMALAGGKQAFDASRRGSIDIFCNGLHTEEQHIPDWFSRAVNNIAPHDPRNLGKMYPEYGHVEETDEKWNVSFPSPHVVLSGPMHQNPFYSAERCRGGCSALLIHGDTGRQVQVDVVHEWDYKGQRVWDRGEVDRARNRLAEIERAWEYFGEDGGW